jgi:phosphohistidine phosphatase
MPELILMRHAAALPAAINGTDFERPLSARGRIAALRSAQRLAAADLKIERVLFSPAQRTRETAAIVAQELALGPAALQAVPDLYAATPRTLRETIATSHANARTLLVVGHNPGISELGHQLGGRLDHGLLATSAFWRLPFDADSWQRLLRAKNPSAAAPD